MNIRKGGINNKMIDITFTTGDDLRIEEIITKPFGLKLKKKPKPQVVNHYIVDYEESDNQGLLHQWNWVVFETFEKNNSYVDIDICYSLMDEKTKRIIWETEPVEC